MTRVVLSAGKVFYDLAARRQQDARDDVALVRVEQLYPLPEPEIQAALSAYPNARDVVWAQEEPANMGAWPFMALHLPKVLGDDRPLRRISRRDMASPASGSSTVHDAEQLALLDAALGNA